MLLGRICPEKGIHLALEASHRAERPLLIGGQVFAYDAHRRYFEEEVELVILAGLPAGIHAKSLPPPVRCRL